MDDDEDEDEDEDDDRPRKKRKKGAKEKSYKNSPTRFIVLGVLVIIMLVLAFFLYQKFQREKENSQRQHTIQMVG